MAGNESELHDEENLAAYSANSTDLPGGSHSSENSTDADSFEVEEPTEEEVALAMRLSSLSDMLVKSGDGHCVVEGTCQEKDTYQQNDEIAPCSACASMNEPHFLHYNKLQKARPTRGLFIWRYRCSNEECAQFFGDFYAYDKSSNSFVRVSEDGSSLHEYDTGNENEDSKVTVDSAEDVESTTGLLTMSASENTEEDAGVGSDSTVATEGTVTLLAPDSRSRRRQRITARKKTSVVPAKGSSATKKIDRHVVDKTMKVAVVSSSKSGLKTNWRVPLTAPPKAPLRNLRGSSKHPLKSPKVQASKRKRGKTTDLLSGAGTPPKRARKGHAHEVITLPVVYTSTSTVDLISSTHHCIPTTSHAESATQTLGGTHYFSVLLDQLINTHAELSSGSTSEVPLNLPTHVSRRLMISQHLLKRQSEQLVEAHKENKRLMTLVNHMNSVIRKFRDEYTPELRNLRDAITVLKNEFSFFQEEFVAEAKKSIDSIHAQQDKVQQRVDDVDKKNRLLNARIDLHVKEKEAVEERADGYLRDVCARDRDVILANKARDKAERKLNDTLYVANNAKCAHCQISDKMRKHLTDVVAEKTVLLEKCQKECVDAKRRAEQADRISQILSKDSEKLKFELSRWKSDAERNISEITRLKEELRKTSTSAMFDKAMTTTSLPRVDNVNTKDALLVTNVSPNCPSGKSPAISDARARNLSPNGLNKASEYAEEDLLRPPPAPLIMPTPPEEPDSLPVFCPSKERRPEISSPVMFFNSPSATSRHMALPSSLPRSHPFNGPLIKNNASGKINGPSSSPSSSAAVNLLHRNGEKFKGLNSAKAGELPQIPLEENLKFKHNRKTDQLCPHDSAPMIGKLPSKICKRDTTFGSPSINIQKRNANAAQHTTDGRSQSKFAPAIPKTIGKSDELHKKFHHQRRELLQINNMLVGKAKNKKKKQLVKQVPRTKTAPSLLSLHGPPPFNGPVSFFGSLANTDKKTVEPHLAENIRTRFSSSPLPWHRGEAAMECSAWESSGHNPEPSPPHSERRTDQLSSHPFEQRSRKNFWDL